MDGILEDTGFWAYAVGFITFLLATAIAIGRVMEARLKGDEVGSGKAGMVLLSCIFALVIALALAIWPLVISIVFSFAEGMGGERVPGISFVIENRGALVLLIWALNIIGLLIARPYIIKTIREGPKGQGG